MQGNCSTQPDAANFPGMNGIDLLPTTTGHCFLLTHDDMLGIVGHKFWADNLYLRAALPPGQDRIYHFPALVVIATLSTGEASGVYLTSMIFQGHGEGSVVGVGADGKVLHCAWIAQCQTGGSSTVTLGGACAGTRPRAPRVTSVAYWSGISIRLRTAKFASHLLADIPCLAALSASSVKFTNCTNM